MGGTNGEGSGANGKGGGPKTYGVWPKAKGAGLMAERPLIRGAVPMM